mgnify:CR=1 FL=1
MALGFFTGFMGCCPRSAISGTATPPSRTAGTGTGSGGFCVTGVIAASICWRRSSPCGVVVVAVAVVVIAVAVDVDDDDDDDDDDATVDVDVVDVDVVDVDGVVFTDLG